MCLFPDFHLYHTTIGYVSSGFASAHWCVWPRLREWHFSDCILPHDAHITEPYLQNIWWLFGWHDCQTCPPIEHIWDNTWLVHLAHLAVLYQQVYSPSIQSYPFEDTALIQGRCIKSINMESNCWYSFWNQCTYWSVYMIICSHLDILPAYLTWVNCNMYSGCCSFV